MNRQELENKVFSIMHDKLHFADTEASDYIDSLTDDELLEYFKEIS